MNALPNFPTEAKVAVPKDFGLYAERRLCGGCQHYGNPCQWSARCMHPEGAPEGAYKGDTLVRRDMKCTRWTAMFDDSAATISARDEVDRAILGLVGGII